MAVKLTAASNKAVHEALFEHYRRATAKFIKLAPVERLQALRKAVDAEIAARAPKRRI